MCKSDFTQHKKKIKVAEHWQVYIGLANCRRRSLTIMTSRTMRTQLHPSGTKASSGVFEDQEQRDFQKTFITQRVHCMCWHNAKWYKNQYSFILDWRDFAHFDNILSAGSHHPDNFIPPFQSWQFVGTKKYCQRWRYIQPHKLHSRPVHNKTKLVLDRSARWDGHDG